MSDPRKILGPEDGLIFSDKGRTVGFFWENPATKGMSDSEQEAYWVKRDAEKAKTK